MSENARSALWWVPNAVTLARIPLAAAAALSALAGPNSPSLSLVALTCFALAAGGDWLDGFLARRWNTISNFGALMDPIADKALVWGLLAAFAVRTDFSLSVVVPIAVIAARDVLVTGVRLVGSTQVRAAAQVSWHGKAKTVAQMGLVSAPLLLAPVGWDLLSSGAPFVIWLVGLWAITAYTAATGAAYARAATLAQRVN